MHPDDVEKAIETLSLIEDGSYNSERPTHTIVEELLGVVWYLHGCIIELGGGPEEEE